MDARAVAGEEPRGAKRRHAWRSEAVGPGRVCSPCVWSSALHQMRGHARRATRTMLLHVAGRRAWTCARRVVEGECAGTCAAGADLVGALEAEAVVRVGRARLREVTGSTTDAPAKI